MISDPDPLDDPDWAPQLGSIWDVAEDDDPEDGEFVADPLAPPFPMAGPEPEWFHPQAWTAAEARAGRALAGAVEACVRLDERLRRVPEQTRLAWRERLALDDIAALLWAEGIRLRPERLALADAGRIGRTEDEDRVLVRAGWARRRLAGQGEVPDAADAVLRFLGQVRRSRETSGEDEPGASGDWAGLPEALIPAGTDPEAAARWAGAMTVLCEAHPLTRSAAAFHLWRGFGLSPPGTWLEPGVVAARIAATEARGGLSAAPLLAGSARALAGHGGAAERLETWLAGLVRAAEAAQLSLDRIETWHGLALDRTTGMQGKGAPSLLRLLAARPIVSARDVSELLGVSKVQARTLLNRLHALGLVRELTGHTRFRYWAAAM